MKRTMIVMGLAALACSSAFAQSRNSFLDAQTMSDVTVSQGANGKAFTVSLGSNPLFVYQNQTYTIQDVFGFWLLDNNNDLNADGGTINQWSYKENYSGDGGIAGWRTNPNTGITPGGSQTYTFDKVQGTPENYGFHMRFKDSAGRVETAYIAAVPEPSSMAIAGVGALVMAFRGRKRK